MDKNLPDDVSKKFLDWVAELPNLSEIKIPRCCFQGTMLSYTYLGTVLKMSFPARKNELQRKDINSIGSVFGKARVAPMKALTIPDLELQAAVLAARLRYEVQQALTVPVERTFM